MGQNNQQLPSSTLCWGRRSESVKLCRAPATVSLARTRMMASKSVGLHRSEASDNQTPERGSFGRICLGSSTSVPKRAFLRDGIPEAEYLGMCCRPCVAHMLSLRIAPGASPVKKWLQMRWSA